MKMDMEAYCWISRIMGNLQHDMGVYKDEKEDPITRDDVVSDLRYFRNDLYALLSKCKVTDDPEEPF